MKKLATIFFLSLCSLCSYSQGSDFGIMAGTSYYMGDLNPGKQFYSTRPAAGVLYRRNFNPRYSLKFSAYYGTIEAYDSESSSKAQQERNLHFKSDIYDFTGQIEFNFLPFVIGESWDYFSPYVFAGVSIFKYNPTAEFEGSWHELQPLKTEGKEYALIQGAFPFGLGLKLSIARNFALGVEWGLRKTFRDYLDDVSTVYANPAEIRKANGEMAVILGDRSLNNEEEFINNEGRQRGNSKNNDWYSFAGLTLTYQIIAKEKCVGVRKK